MHETGHCIAVIAAGGTVTKFSILTAHMSYICDEDFSNVQSMWVNVNGTLFPMILSYVYMFFYQEKRTNSLYQMLSISAIIPTGALVPWVFIPFLYLNGNAPIRDDTTKFLDIFAMYHSPIFVTIGALLLIGLSIALVIKKKIFKNYIDMRKAKQ